MKVSDFSRPFVLTAMTGGLLFLAGCSGSGLSGSYSNSIGTTTISFGPGDSFELVTGDRRLHEKGTYSIEEGKIRLNTKGGSVGFLVKKEDGCLDSPTLGKLCPPKSKE